ncbi:unnamed protein product [Pylaiella littoralis]
MPEGSDAGVGNNELAQQLIAMLEAQQKAQQEVMAKLTERIESLEIRSPARTAEVVQQGESPGSGEAAPGVQQGLWGMTIEYTKLGGQLKTFFLFRSFHIHSWR